VGNLTSCFCELVVTNGPVLWTSSVFFAAYSRSRSSVWHGCVNLAHPRIAGWADAIVLQICSS